MNFNMKFLCVAAELQSISVLTATKSLKMAKVLHGFMNSDQVRTFVCNETK